MEDNNRSQDPINPDLGQNNLNPQNDGQDTKESTYWENINQAQPNTPAGQWADNDAQQTQASQTPEQFYQYYQQQMNGAAGNQQNYAQPQYNQPYYQQGINQKPPKKKHRGALVALIVVLLLIFTAAGTAFALRNTLSNTFAKMTKSPAEYYSYIEKNEIKDAVDQIAAYPDLQNSKPQAAHVTTDLSFNRDSIDSLLQSTGMSLSDLESMLGVKLENVGFDATVATNGDISNEIIGLRLNKTNIISAEMFMDSTAKDIFLRVPELSKAYLSISSKDAPSSVDISGLKNLNSEKIADLMTRYSNIIIDDIKDVQIENNATLSVDTLTTECTRLTVTISSEDFAAMVKDVLEEAKNDQTIIDLLPMLNISEDDYKNSIDDAIDNANADNYTDTNLVMKVYVNSKGEVIGREFSDEETDGGLGYTVLSSGDKTEYRLYVNDDSGNEVFNIEGNHVKNQDGAYTGDARVDVSTNNDTISNVRVDISYEDLRTEKKNGHSYQYGTVTISSMDLMGMQVTMDYSVEDTVQKCKVDVQMGAVSVVSADIAVDYPDNYDVTMPDNNAEVYDINDISSYEATMDLQGYITKLADQLGIDSQTIMDFINSLSGYGY